MPGAVNDGSGSPRFLAKYVAIMCFAIGAPR